MNNNHTVERLKEMRMNAMAQLHDQHVRENRLHDFTPDEYLSLLADHEWEDRQARKTQRLFKQANFRQKASLAEINYTHNRNLDKNMFQRLGTLDFMKRKENIIINGAAGVGKSYLAHALGHQACLMGYKTIYSSTSRLLKNFKLSKADGTYLKELKKLAKADLLVLDDFGLQAFDNHGRETLMDIIDDRYNVASTILASQIPVSAWHDLIQENTMADAILDRIVNSSHRITLDGISLRKGMLKTD